MSCPTGTVTFLFTDVEGSTRRWEERPAEMQQLLARHDGLLRTLIGAHGGHVFKTMGDAFCAAFATPQAATAAALAAQRALAEDAEMDSEGDRLRVRMALHTGAPEARDGDYFGPPLNRVARLLSAGHGGQVLLSEVVQNLVRDSLPPGASLRDLGEHRFKDLIRPERIYHLDAPELSADFPPLRTLDARPHNLPLQPTPLIGREREIRETTERLHLAEPRLLTLTGAGGTGKTRLALHVAAELLETFPDGVFFVNLAPIADPLLVPSAVAQALGAREVADRPLTETLVEHLREKRLLLLLDNFEQVAEAAPLVSELLGAALGLKVLVTSRVALRLRGEQEYPVPALSLPDPKLRLPLEQLTQYEAVRLFIERAQGAKPEFVVTNENAPAVAEICQRLDGLPLAIELAAARIKLLPPQAMLARLQSRLRLLTGGARDLPARQQTLRGAIAWSFDLLSEEEKLLFRRLAVFSGGRTLEAVEAVCDPTGELEVLEGVSSLIGKSLLRQEEDAAGEPRFLMLETIQEFAREKLEESAEAERLRRGHAAYFVALAEDAEPQLVGAGQAHWLSRLEAEHDNFRAALRNSLASGDSEGAARLAGMLWRFWFARGHVREGRHWLADALAAPDLTPGVRARLLHGAGTLANAQNDYLAAQPLLEECLALYRTLPDPEMVARLLNTLGTALYLRGDLEGAESLYQEALALLRWLGEPRVTGSVLNNLGIIAQRRREYTRAEALYEEFLQLARETGDVAHTALALHNVGHVAYDQGHLGRAEACCGRACCTRARRETGTLPRSTWLIWRWRRAPPGRPSAPRGCTGRRRAASPPWAHT